MIIDKIILNSVRSKLDLALERVGSDLGLTLKTGNISYTHQSATIKVECAVHGYSLRENDFNLMKQNGYYDLDRFHVGDKYRSSLHGIVTLTGASLKARKYPFFILTELGGKYKLSYNGLSALSAI